MKRYLYGRYMPYIRIRYRKKPRPILFGNAFLHDFAYFLRILLSIVFLIAAFGKLSANFSAAVENICEYKAAHLVNDYIDRGVLAATFAFQDRNFVSVAYNKDGTVASIETNGIEINRFASVLSESIQNEIKSREHERIKVPLGSATGVKLLSSYGFSIPFRIISAGKVKVVPVSQFHDAGINQTVHKLKMNVSVNVKILFPLAAREEKIEREIIVSETVIVGDVPEMFLSRTDETK